MPEPADRVAPGANAGEGTRGRTVRAKRPAHCPHAGRRAPLPARRPPGGRHGPSSRHLHRAPPRRGLGRPRHCGRADLRGLRIARVPEAVPRTLPRHPGEREGRKRQRTVEVASGLQGGYRLRRGGCSAAGPRISPALLFRNLAHHARGPPAGRPRVGGYPRGRLLSRDRTRVRASGGSGTRSFGSTGSSPTSCWKSTD